MQSLTVPPSRAVFFRSDRASVSKYSNSLYFFVNLKNMLGQIKYSSQICACDLSPLRYSLTRVSLNFWSILFSVLRTTHLSKMNSITLPIFLQILHMVNVLSLSGTLLLPYTLSLFCQNVDVGLCQQ